MKAILLLVLQIACIVFLCVQSIHFQLKSIELKKSNRHLSKLVVKLTKENERLLKVEDRFSKHLFNEHFTVVIKNLPRNWNSPPRYKGVK